MQSDWLSYVPGRPVLPSVRRVGNYKREGGVKKTWDILQLILGTRGDCICAVAPTVTRVHGNITPEWSSNPSNTSRYRRALAAAATIR